MPEYVIPKKTSTFNDLTGKVFGQVTVIEYVGARVGCLNPARKNKPRLIQCWKCLCVCGKTKVIAADDILHRKGKGIKCDLSCGCIGRSISGMSNRKHGHLANNERPSEYMIWINIKRRCLDPKNRQWPSYGGRGITLCQEWINSFEAFIDDMGRRPSLKHSIDRKDNDKGYFKDNCRWATQKEQCRNKRNNAMVTYKGQTMTITDLEEMVGAKTRYIYDRHFRYGWSIEEAVETPLNFKLHQ